MSRGDTMQGKRVERVGDPAVMHPILNPGEYRQKFIRGRFIWEACTPNGLLGNLSNHEITEHEDGTITANPSILVSTPTKTGEMWHGYLERGVWREV
jgi:hypothetical protein